MIYALVFIGGGLGSLARFGLGNFIQQTWPSQFPFATLMVNIISSFILGLMIAWLAVRPTQSDHYRLFFATGFCGGLSTFSTFTMEVFSLAKSGLVAMAVINILVSVVACLAALWLGTFLFRNKFYEKTIIYISFFMSVSIFEFCTKFQTTKNRHWYCS